MNPERIYLIKNLQTGEEHLVRASSAPLALNHLMHSQYEVTIPRPLVVGDMMERGCKILRANGADGGVVTGTLFETATAGLPT